MSATPSLTIGAAYGKLHWSIEPAENKLWLSKRTTHLKDWDLEVGDKTAVPVSPGVVTYDTAVEERFEALVNQWWKETGRHSSVTKIILNRAYLQIIGLGEPAVPLILRELQTRPGHWFSALDAITGDDSVMSNEEGSFNERVAAWLSWGKRKGYIS